MKLKTKKKSNIRVDPGANVERPPEAHITAFNSYKKGDTSKGKAIRLMGGWGQYRRLLKWVSKQPVRPTKKPGRNKPCICGSGLKFKKCCINK